MQGPENPGIKRLVAVFLNQDLRGVEVSKTLGLLNYAMSMNYLEIRESMIDMGVKVGTSVIAKSTILSNSTIGDSCIVSNSMIGENTHIGDNCVIENAIIAHDSDVPTSTKVAGGTWPIA